MTVRYTKPRSTALPGYSAQNRASGFRPAGMAYGDQPDLYSEQHATWSGDPHAPDPASGIPGMPPNLGESLVPHVISFQGIVSSVSRIYRPSDEAIKDSFENARFMRNDPIIMECVEQRQRSVALLDWHIEPDDENDEEQKAVCNELKAILEQIPRFMQYRENLLHATWFGRYAVQQKFGWKKIRGQMRIAVPSWKPVHGDKIVFRYDDGTKEHDPDQVGIRVGAGFTTGNTLTKSWSAERLNKVEPTDYGLAYFLEHWERPLLAIHKHYLEDGEYEDPTNAGRIHGVGLRSRLYWAWYQKQETLAMLMEYLERSGTGIELWYYPWGNSAAEDKTRKAAEERIAGGSNRNVILVPKPPGEEGMAYGVDRIEPGFAGAETMKEIIGEYFGHMIKRYILGQTLTSEASATGLGSGLAELHLDTYMQIIRYDATLLEESITTELLQPLLKFNWPHLSDCPIRFRINTEAPDVESKLKAWQQAFEMGVKLPAQAVMDLIGAPKPDQGEEVLDASQQQQMQQDSLDAQAAAQREHESQIQLRDHQRQRESEEHQSRFSAQGLQPPNAEKDEAALREALAQRGVLSEDESNGQPTQDYQANEESPPSEDSERELVVRYDGEAKEDKPEKPTDSPVDYSGWKNTDGPIRPGPAMKATPFEAAGSDGASLVDSLAAEFASRGWTPPNRRNYDAELSLGRFGDTKHRRKENPNKTQRSVFQKQGTADHSGSVDETTLEKVSEKSVVSTA